MPTNRSKIAPLDLGRLYQQLAALLLTGMPLAECFEILRQDIDSPQLGKLVDELLCAARDGLSLSECFAKSTLPTKDIVTRLLIGAQTRQEMHVILMALEDEQDQLALITKMKRKLFFWPFVYLFFAAGFMVTLTIFVLPSFSDFYSGVNVALPMPTQIILWFGPYVMLSLVIFGVGWYGLYKAKFPLVRHVTDSVVVRLPMIGRFSKRVAVSQYIRTLCFYLLRNIPPHEALVLAARSVDNSAIGRALMHDTTIQDRGLLENLRGNALVPKRFIKAIMIAERTNTLKEVLRYNMDAYSGTMMDDMVLYQDSIELFFKIIVGALFALIALAVYLPIFKMGALA